MEGPDHTNEELMGVIPRMIGTIFDEVLRADSNIEFNITVAYFEIYMEKIRDLLQPSQDNMVVREHPQKGIWVDGATEASVVSPEEVYAVMQQGASNRATAATNMNERSSRSHSLFLLTVSQTSLVDLSKKSGKLYLVDLAGSEKAGKTGATGEKLDEAKMINKSLTALGLVITKLTQGQDHIPYRDSKLTRVLTESLGGNAKTALIIACSPAVYNESETKGTLEFGVRAKMIKNKPKVNREQSIPELKALVQKLEKKIALQGRRIKTLEGFILDNGLEVPSDGAGGGEKGEVGEEEEDRPMSSGRRASLDASNLELAKEKAELQERADELEQKLVAESEEKEFMKSLMDDLLEQLAQKENEKKKLEDEQERYDQETIELRSKENDANQELSTSAALEQICGY
jgi:kinesin family protein 5